MTDQTQAAAEPRVVTAVGASANANLSGNWASAERQELAMADAIKAAYEEGVTDPDEVHARMMAARDAVLEADAAGAPTADAPVSIGNNQQDNNGA